MASALVVKVALCGDPSTRQRVMYRFWFETRVVRAFTSEIWIFWGRLMSGNLSIQ
jgi:hypothetical protein